MAPRFSISRVLYTGARSVVFAARDRHTEKDVALKLHKNALREVDNMLRAADCNPAKVLQLAVKRPVRASEVSAESCSEGRPLLDLHRAHEGVVTPLQRALPDRPPECACDRSAGEAMFPYFDAVSELHERSTLEAHCDVKFANFVSPAGGGDGRCIVDMDMSLVPGGERKARGTPVYMPPEAYAFGELNPMVDSWALGVMLYQACHPGRLHPFTANSDLNRRNLARDLGGIAYNRDMWENASAPEAADLAYELLRNEIYARPTPTEATFHNLFSKYRT